MVALFKLKWRLHDHPNQGHAYLPTMTLVSNPDGLLNALSNSY